MSVSGDLHWMCEGYQGGYLEDQSSVSLPRGLFTTWPSSDPSACHVEVAFTLLVSGSLG